MLAKETQELLDHLHWADAAMWRAVLAHPPAVTDRRTRELLVHTTQTVGGYLQMWRGQPIELPEADAFTDAGAAAPWARSRHADLAAYVAALSDDSLGRLITFPWADKLAEYFGEARPATIRECIVQLALHCAYHRGQVNARLRELGGEPPMVDYIAWHWAGRPSPEWPTLSNAN